MDFKKSKLTLVVVEDDEQVTSFPYLGLIQQSVVCAQAGKNTKGRLSTLLAQAVFLLPRTITNIMHANFQSFCFCI